MQYFCVPSLARRGERKEKGFRFLTYTSKHKEMQDSTALVALRAYADSLCDADDGTKAALQSANGAFASAAKGAIAAVGCAARKGEKDGALAELPPPSEEPSGTLAAMGAPAVSLVCRERMLQAAAAVCDSFLESPRGFYHAMYAAAETMDVMEALGALQQVAITAEAHFLAVTLMYIIASQVTHELRRADLSTMPPETDAYEPSNRMFLLETMKSMLSEAGVEQVSTPPPAPMMTLRTMSRMSRRLKFRWRCYMKHQTRIKVRRWISLKWQLGAPRARMWAGMLGC